jgi:hypothetical protein
VVRTLRWNRVRPDPLGRSHCSTSSRNRREIRVRRRRRKRSHAADRWYAGDFVETQHVSETLCVSKPPTALQRVNDEGCSRVTHEFLSPVSSTRLDKNSR